MARLGRVVFGLIGLLGLLVTSGCPEKTCGEVLCEKGEICDAVTEICVAGACSLDADCGDLRYRCRSGSCVPVADTCLRDSDCTDPLRACERGWCILRQVTCTADTDCAELQVCDGGWCRGSHGFDCTGDPPACAGDFQCLSVEETGSVQRCLRPCVESAQCGLAQFACLDIGVSVRYCAPNHCPVEEALGACETGGPAGGTCLGFYTGAAPVAWCFEAGEAAEGQVCDAAPTWDAPEGRCAQGSWCLVASADDETGLCYRLCDVASNTDPEVTPGCEVDEVCVDLRADPSAPTLGYCALQP